MKYVQIHWVSDNERCGRVRVSEMQVENKAIARRENEPRCLEQKAKIRPNHGTEAEFNRYRRSAV